MCLLIFAILLREKKKGSMALKYTPIRPRKTISNSMRQRIYEKYGKRCAYCGKIIPNRRDMRVDHIVSVRRGGKDEEANYQPACHDCNRYKDTLTVDDFREELTHIVDRIAKEDIRFRLAVKYGLITVNLDKNIEFLYEKEIEGENVEVDEVGDLLSFGLHSSSITHSGIQNPTPIPSNLLSDANKSIIRAILAGYTGVSKVEE